TNWLKGKSIGVTFGTTGHYFIARYLGKLGLAPKDVNLVNLAPGDREQAFLRGDVAAVVTWPPPSNILGQRKMRLVTTGRRQGIAIPSAVVAQADYLAANRETALRFLKLHFQLINMIRNDPDKFVATQVKWFANKGIKQDPTFLKTFHTQRIKYYNLHEQIKSFSPVVNGLSPIGAAFHDMAAFFLQWEDQSAKIPDFGKIVDAQVTLLREVHSPG
ncbi:MAG: ABC transporter substrate-binding protein, partial [Bradyrhizobium sp.]